MIWALRVADRIDRLSEVVGRMARWCLLANALLIAGNALSRKLFWIASPSAYDLQWHFMAAVVLLMAAYTLKLDEHVRVDVFSHLLGRRGLAWLDLVGMTLIVLPLCIGMILLSWPQFLDAFVGGETRATRESMSDIPAWIIKGLIPLGFFLLLLQSAAIAIRCAAEIDRGCTTPIA